MARESTTRAFSAHMTAITVLRKYEHKIEESIARLESEGSVPGRVAWRREALDSLRDSIALLESDRNARTQRSSLRIII